MSDRLKYHPDGSPVICKGCSGHATYRAKELCSTCNAREYRERNGPVIYHNDDGSTIKCRHCGERAARFKARRICNYCYRKQRIYRTNDGETVMCSSCLVNPCKIKSDGTCLSCYKRKPYLDDSGSVIMCDQCGDRPAKIKFRRLCGACMEKNWRMDHPEEYMAREARRDPDRREAWRFRYIREYYARTADEQRERSRNWRKRNPDKMANQQRIYAARKAGLEATLTEDEWQAILVLYGNQCSYCFAKDVDLDREHWIPATRGGGYAAENIVPSCRSCNSSKGTMTGEEFLVLRRRLEIEKNIDVSDC